MPQEKPNKYVGKKEWLDVSREAKSFCSDENFQQWVAAYCDDPFHWDAQQTENRLLKLLGLSSLGDLALPTRARRREHWNELRRKFRKGVF